MSRVSSLSVLSAGHNIIGWHMHFGLWKCMWLYEEPFSTLAYPFVCMVFSPCDDYQFIDVSRCENSSWSTRKWWFRWL